MQKYKKAKNDIIIGVCILAFAAAYFGFTYSFRLMEYDYTVDAAFFPRIMAVFAAVLGVIIMVRGILEVKALPAEDKKISAEQRRADTGSLIRILLVIADLLAAAFAFKQLGFILTLPWMMFILFVIVNPKGKRKWWLYAVLSIVLPIAIFFIFYYGFSTLLPMGILRKFLSRFL